MRRRHLFRILAATASLAVSQVPAAENSAGNEKQPAPDDEISRVCDLIARHLDRETASDAVYEVLITILRQESRPFEVPDWLAEDEFWRYSQHVERKEMKRRAGIAGI